MEFIGKGGWAAPRLKDASLSDDKLREAYFEIVMIMRTLYQKGRLVHGDLSEYNILYFEGHLYIIDVSQSVDFDHPSALDFLKEDCLHVSDFFKKRGVAVMTVTDLFNFVIDQNIADADDYLEKVQHKMLENGDTLANDDEKQQQQLPQNTVEDTLDLQSSESCSKAGPKTEPEARKATRKQIKEMGPEVRKAARKENKKKVKEEMREVKEKKREKKRKKWQKQSASGNNL